MSVRERKLKLTAYTYGIALGLVSASVIAIVSPKIGPIGVIFLAIILAGLAYLMDRSLHTDSKDDS